MTLGEIKAAAAEMGIEPRLVEEAAAVVLLVVDGFLNDRFRRDLREVP